MVWTETKEAYFTPFTPNERCPSIALNLRSQAVCVDQLGKAIKIDIDPILQPTLTGSQVNITNDLTTGTLACIISGGFSKTDLSGKSDV
jgi:hypothetical protein